MHKIIGLKMDMYIRITSIINLNTNKTAFNGNGRDIIEI
jgi:hypothetical protein